MKGLLLKDFYMILAYCRIVIIAVIVFSILNVFGDNTFFIVYPAILTSMVSVSILSYDENSKWDIYCNTLPVTRAQQVSSKYIISLLSTIIIIVTSTLSLYLRQIYHADFNVSDIISSIIIILALSLLGPSISLPFIFKLGVNKGKISYYIMFGAIFALMNFITSNTNEYQFIINSPYILVLISLILFIISWYTSIAFYKKRDL